MLIELEDVRRTIGLVLGCRQVAADDRLLEDLGAESADVLNIMVTMENKYSLTIDESEMSAVATVRDVYLLLRKITHDAIPGPDAAQSA